MADGTRESVPDRGDRPAAAAAESPDRRVAPLAAVAVGGALVLVATMGVLQRVEPFATWYYVFAWYGTLLALDGAVALAGGAAAAAPADATRGARRSTGRHRFLLLARPGFTLTLLAWSAVAWLFFEVLNFRLRNWYYVFVPDIAVVRWPAILMSFATVLPAVLTSEALLAGLGVARRTRWPAIRWTPARLRAVRVAGGLMFALPLVWPRLFFPLVWGGVLLLLEPSNYRRDPSRSLLGDLERGRPGRLLRLLLGGAMIGLLWELFNIEARGKWIYTVPGLEELKLFEMPLLGFLGFPPFALECFAIWQALVLGGLAVPRHGSVRRTAPSRRAGAAVAAVLLSGAVLAGMERRTISSYTPRLDELPGDVPTPVLADAGYDVFSLAEAPAADVARAAGTSVGRAAAWVETARLAALRGIGTRNAHRLIAAGVETVDELAAADPGSLAARLRTITGDDVVDARVRVWVRAARRQTARRPPET